MTNYNGLAIADVNERFWHEEGVRVTPKDLLTIAMRFTESANPREAVNFPQAIHFEVNQERKMHSASIPDKQKRLVQNLIEPHAGDNNILGATLKRAFTPGFVEDSEEARFADMWKEIESNPVDDVLDMADALEEKIVEWVDLGDTDEAGALEIIDDRPHQPQAEDSGDSEMVETAEEPRPYTPPPKARIIPFPSRQRQPTPEPESTDRE